MHGSWTWGTFSLSHTHNLSFCLSHTHTHTHTHLSLSLSKLDGEALTLKAVYIKIKKLLQALQWLSKMVLLSASEMHVLCNQGHSLCWPSSLRTVRSGVNRNVITKHTREEGGGVRLGLHTSSILQYCQLVCWHATNWWRKDESKPALCRWFLYNHKWRDSRHLICPLQWNTTTHSPMPRTAQHQR